MYNTSYIIEYDSEYKIFVLNILLKSDRYKIIKFTNDFSII